MKKQKYSVMRIERAKQRALTGDAFKVQRGSKDKYEIDWTADDEEMLLQLVCQWDRATGHKGLNVLIDDHPFSGGTHAGNLPNYVEVNHDQMGPGTIRLLDPTPSLPGPAFTDEGIEFAKRDEPIDYEAHRTPEWVASEKPGSAR